MENFFGFNSFDDFSRPSDGNDEFNNEDEDDDLDDGRCGSFDGGSLRSTNSFRTFIASSSFDILLSNSTNYSHKQKEYEKKKNGNKYKLIQKRLVDSLFLNLKAFQCPFILSFFRVKGNDYTNGYGEREEKLRLRFGYRSTSLKELFSETYG